jgi:hypothetical protein
MAKRSPPRFLICVNNDGYAASLEKGKVYRMLADAPAAAKGMVRILDESGEDYLYPSERFVAVELPKSAVNALLAAS